MKRIQVLDCTLRDGGYCNDWNFGTENITRILHGLKDAGIDVVECGYLSERALCQQGRTQFSRLSQIEGFLPPHDNYQCFVAMVNFGEYDAKRLPPRGHSAIEGIRLAFHKRDAANALDMCKTIREKGYRVYVQPMVTLAYRDEEFLELVKSVNRIRPEAFYIVDSFGSMKRKDLLRFFYLADHNLSPEIKLGFHSHNNLQLAYSNAQTLVDIQTDRRLIIDTSVYGMGRGAGNLNTELFIDYLNEKEGYGYALPPLLLVIDEALSFFYDRNRWGFSLPNYISAVYQTHPNYAGYLDGKKTLTVEAMEAIFSRMADEKRTSFDQAYAEQLYEEYMETGKLQEEHRNEFVSRLRGKEILLVGPGKSSLLGKDLVRKFMEKPDAVCISVNFEYPHCRTDYIFLSNLRRAKNMGGKQLQKCIVTSNIPSVDVYMRVSYKELLNNVETVYDNAGLMAIKLLILSGVRKVTLIGFDGYSHDVADNFAYESMILVNPQAVLDSFNRGMQTVLRQYKNEIQIQFLMKSRCLQVDEDEYAGKG